MGLKHRQYLNFPQGTTNTTDVVLLILQVAVGNGLTVTTPTGYTLYTTLTDSRRPIKYGKRRLSLSWPLIDTVWPDPAPDYYTESVPA